MCIRDRRHPAAPRTAREGRAAGLHLGRQRHADRRGDAPGNQAGAVTPHPGGRFAHNEKAAAGSPGRCLFRFRHAASGPDLRAAALFELPDEVPHDTLDGLLVQRAGLVLQHETQRIGLLALGELVAFIDVEERDAPQQFAFGGEGRGAQLREGYPFVDVYKRQM